MSIKALQKQLIAAVAMVIVAAIALSSSTFAWFAANTTVTATGMNVAAQSDSVFLEIKGDATNSNVGEGTVTTSDTDYTTTGTLTMTNVKLYPTAHESLSALADITAAKADPATDTQNWYYRYSDKTDDANSNLTAKTAVTVANFNKYVAAVTSSGQLHDADNDAYDLYVKDITIAADTGITAIVAGADGFQEFTASVADNTATAVALSDSVTHTAQTVTVYLYIDGNNTNVYTDNIDQLTGAVTMTLGCYTVDTL